MTIPFLVMLISAAIWLIMVLTPKISHPWVIDVCRISFAASALVVLFGYSTKPTF